MNQIPCERTRPRNVSSRMLHKIKKETERLNCDQPLVSSATTDVQTVNTS